VGAVAHSDHLTGQAAPQLLSDVQTPPPVFALSKPFTKTALQEPLSQALVAWSDEPRPCIPSPRSQNDPRVSPESVGLMTPFPLDIPPDSGGYPAQALEGTSIAHFMVV
jgi:hypothetical protein